MQITLSEYLHNVDKYLKLADTEKIQIIENDQTVHTLTDSEIERTKAIHSIFGIIKSDKPISIDEARAERLSKKLGYKI